MPVVGNEKGVEKATKKAVNAAKKMDAKAVAAAEEIFEKKTIVPVNINAIAEHGGALNCISWEL